MKCNYDIYEENYEMKDDFIEQKILNDVLLKHQHKHEVIRPDISIKKDLIITASSVIAFGLPAFVFSDFTRGFSWIVFLLFWAFIFMKKTMITLILFYQKYAPEFVRSSCVFEPCCSEYMKRAIEKYGVIRGVLKGLKRISRCRIPNGGIDEP